jgi:signal transduction histidine kinase
MMKQITLRVRIYLILTTLVLITFGGGLVMVWYTYRMQNLFTYIFDNHVKAFQAAEELETALVNQKGFVTYFVQDGDPDWLRQLGEYRQIFRERLKEVRLLVETEPERVAVKGIEKEYNQYISSKDKVISYYIAGDFHEGIALHKKVRHNFFRILDLCEEYKNLQTQMLKKAQVKSHSQAIKLRILAVTAIMLVLLLAIILTFFLLKYILEPIRKLAIRADRNGASIESADEVTALSRSVSDLIEDIDQTHTELERSRENLLQSEKMAMVGKLAAGVAHSIRNPLTSVKMRLFSLDKTLNLSEHQREDFDVISDEIRHIDTIVQNFLEFSRPPKLKMLKVSPSDVVDSAIQLLHHRLESFEVGIDLHRQKPLPEIQVDPEQLKEVLVNLVINACESMDGGGLIDINEEEGFDESLGQVVIIRLTDNGPGIPESIKAKIFEPFFTAKEEGSGLGLSIAARIVEKHGGKLDLSSTEGEGAAFTISLPVNSM